MPSKPKLGTGTRSKNLVRSLAAKGGVRDPGALAAAIGRKKFGKKRFQELAKKGFVAGFYEVLEKSAGSFTNSVIKGVMPQAIFAAGSLADRGGELLEQEELEKQQAEEAAYREHLRRQGRQTSMYKGAAFPWGYVGAGAAGLGAGLGAGYLMGKRQGPQPPSQAPEEEEVYDMGVPDFQSPGYITEAELAQMYARASQAQNAYEMPGYAYFG